MKPSKRRSLRRFTTRKLQPSIPIAGVGIALLLLIAYPGPAAHTPPVKVATSATKHNLQPAVAPKAPVNTPPASQPAPAAAVAAPTPKPAVRSAPAPAPAVTPAPSSSVNSLVPVTPPPASGSSGTSGSSSSSSSSGSSQPNPQPVSYTSTNWSGYLAANGSFSGVSGDWTVPAPTGNGSSTTADATWIGIGGVTSSDLIQVGTDNSVSATGQVSSEAFYELLPDVSQTIASLTVAPGDHMSASIVEQSAGQWTIAISDLTTNNTYTTSVAYSSSHSSAEWIEEDPSYTNGQLVPFDNFGTVAFSSAAAVMNGASVNLTDASAQMITLVNNSGTPRATPSSISGNTSFSVTRQNTT